MFNIPVMYLWLALTVIFVFVEIATTNIVSIWFALGALAATLCAWLFPQAHAVQAVIFLAVTAATLYFTRPAVAKILGKKTPTNMDMYVGEVAEVIEDIIPEGSGRVKVGGLTWKAKSSSYIATKERCRIIKIEGASLVVEKIVTTV